MPWWYLRDGGFPSAPKHVELILSDLCNQSCSFCAYRMDGYTNTELFTKDAELAPYGHSNPKRWIPTDRVMKLLDEFKAAGVLAVQFTGGGEPTVHPEHQGIFARTLDLGLSCALVSNGLNWSTALMEKTLPRFSWVRVSIDAGDADTYARTRQTKPSNFSRVLRNVTTLSEAIASVKSQCVLGIGFVVTPDNWREIIAAVRDAKTHGAHNIRLSAMFSQHDQKPFLPFWQEAKELCREAKREFEDDSFKVYDRFGERIDDLIQGRPKHALCSYQHYTTVIGGDLKVYRCCNLAYATRGIIAGGDDLKTRRFDKFWASDERKADFAGFDGRGCERCQFRIFNNTMAEIAGEKPLHAEFT